MMPNSTKPQLKPRVAAVLALAALLVSATLAAPPLKPEDGPTITPNYKDADLSQIIQAVAEVTGKNFIIDPRVNAKDTMLSATPMSPAAFYEAFLSVLQVYGYVAVPAGKVIKIVPNTDARQLPANDLPNDVSRTSDEIVAQIISMNDVTAAQRRRLRPVILSMTTPLSAGGDTQVRYLRYADAEKIADKLKGQATATAKAQGGPPAAGAGGGSPNVDASVTIWADVSTNALIITAPPKIMKSLMAVIDKLDIRRAQVQVEAIIVEIDVNKSANIGVQWLLDGGNSYGYGVTNLPGQGTSIVDLAAAVLGATGSTSALTNPNNITGTTGTTGLSSS